tara:strand:+ start:417 stop:2024 length:1608 start_codon:yes stop_codon:yes gene_type:complete
MPQLINPDSAEYKALFGDEAFVPLTPISTSADYKCGAVSNELEYLDDYIAQLVGGFDPDNAVAGDLDIIVKTLSNLERIFDEADSALLNRVYSLLRRNGNDRWNTKWALRDAMKHFWPTNTMYIEQSYIEDDAAVNGDFEVGSGGTFTGWTEATSASSTVTEETTTPFKNGRAAKFTIDGSGSLVSLYQVWSSEPSGKKKIGLFYKDNAGATDVLEISVQRSSDSKFYDFANNGWIAADTETKDLPSVGDVWTFADAYFETDGTEDLTITFRRKAGEDTYNVTIDRVEYGTFQDYSSTSVIIVFTGELTGSLMQLWPTSGRDNLLDRGECESATAPMVAGETVPVLSNATWVQDATQKHMGSNSFLLTKTVAAGTSGYAVLADDEVTSNMHGFSAGTTYTLRVQVHVPTTGGPLGTEFLIEFGDYDGGWVFSSQAGVATYDAFQQVSVTRAIRAGATGVTLRCVLHSDAANTEYVYVDHLWLDAGTTDIDSASFFDNDFLGGEGGGYSAATYQDILDRLRPAGTKARIESVPQGS